MTHGKGNYAATIELREKLFELIKTRVDGISRTAIQKKFGIHSPSLEEQRKGVWKLSSALVGLQHDGFIVSDMSEGERFYYPRAS